MNNYSVKTPVLFLIYNRPDLTQLVFNEIRKVAPKKLFIAADGPDNSKSSDRERCREVQNIVKQIDWDCEIYTLFREKNLGCERTVSLAIDWFFQNAEEGIILEDDCLPNSSFFRFCEENLLRYRSDEKIMTISGNYFGWRNKKNKYSYTFSRYPLIWGWATWRRSWEYYDPDMRLWPELRNSKWLKKVLDKSTYVRYWDKVFQDSYEGKNSSWAYKWIFCSWVKNGLTILPTVNLVSNIGFGPEATHTKLRNRRNANFPREKINFPLRHPPSVIRNDQLDNFLQKTHFSGGRIWIISIVIKIIKKILATSGDPLAVVNKKT